MGPAHWGAGYNGTGTLRVADGIAVASSFGYLGYYSGSAGTATITGAGSKWTNSSDLYVGFSGGGGRLTINQGGQVSNVHRLCGRRVRHHRRGHGDRE